MSSRTDHERGREAGRNEGRNESPQSRRRGVRRTAIALGIVALAVYGAFILSGVFGSAT